MILPELHGEVEKTGKRVLEFKGYNATSVIEDGEMKDMYNLSSDDYPCLTQRKPRGIFDSRYEDPTKILARREKLAVVSEGEFYYDGVRYPDLLLSDSTQMVSINTKICFFPEKMYFDIVTKTTGDLGYRETVAAGRAITITNNSIAVNDINAFKGLNVGDAVVVSGATTNVSSNVSAVVQGNTNGMVTFPDDTFVFDGESYTEAGRITISRNIPDMDHVMESDNRLWGCGGNFIYACKLGDPLNWEYYQNTSLDSYAVEVGTDGDFTGCINYSAHRVFLKEDYMHKVYGSKPTAYQITTSECHGLEKGSSGSVCVINEVAFYKSRRGIMAYAGGVPELVSEPLGNTKYKNAVGGTDGVKYYISMESDKSYLFVFDMEKGLWHKEDNIKVRSFAYFKGKLLFVNDEDKKIYEMDSDTPIDEKIEWSAVLGEFHEFEESKKIYSRLSMRFSLEDESTLSVSIQLDNSEEWILVQHIYASKSKTAFVPIIPRRCDSFKVQLKGKGRCKIESLVREYRIGGDV